MSDEQQQPIPADLAELANELNEWAAAYRHLRPGEVTFRATVVDVVRDGQIESGVQVWAMRRNGVTVDTVPPELARELAHLLLEKAREAETGLRAARHLPAGLNGAKR